MDAKRTISALETLWDQTQRDPTQSVFYLISKGPFEKSAQKTICCMTSDPVFLSVLISLKDGLDELREQSGTTPSRKQIVEKMREQLKTTLTLLQCEDIPYQI
jgi:hypothetical protein